MIEEGILGLFMQSPLSSSFLSSDRSTPSRSCLHEVSCPQFPSSPAGKRSDSLYGGPRSQGLLDVGPEKHGLAHCYNDHKCRSSSLFHECSVPKVGITFNDMTLSLCHYDLTFAYPEMN